MHDRTPHLPPHSNRLFPTYSLRGLMLAVLVCSVILATVTRRAHNQRHAVAAVREAGGEVWYDFQLGSDGNRIESPTLPGPDWLRNWLGIDYVARVRGVTANLYDRDFPPELFDAIGAFDSLKEIDLADSGVTTRGLERLARLGNLESVERLNLSNALVEGDGLAILAEMPNLKSLDVTGCRLCDVGFGHVGRCRSLEDLNLAFSDANDRRLRQISTLVRLESFRLSGTNVTDAGLTALREMSRLKRLWLNGTLVEGPGFDRLPSTLVELDVSETLVDDAGLARLISLARLERLMFFGNSISFDGAASLLALPKLRFEPSIYAVLRLAAPEYNQELKDYLASAAFEATPLRKDQLAERFSEIAGGYWDYSLIQRCQNLLQELDEFEAQPPDSPAATAQRLSEWSSRFCDPSMVSDFVIVKSYSEPSPSRWHREILFATGDCWSYPLFFRVRTDRLLQKACRRAGRSAETFLVWAGLNPRTLAHEEGRQIVAAAADLVPYGEVLRSVVAQEDHQLSCLAAAVAIDPCGATWCALLRAAPPPLFDAIASAWQMCEPENAAAWYASALDGEHYRRHAPFAEALAYVRRGNELPKIQLGLSRTNVDPWREFAWTLGTPKLTFFWRPETRSPGISADGFCQRVVEFCQQLPPAARIGDAEELPPECYEMLRRFIVAPPQELYTVRAGCKSLATLLESDEKRFVALPHLGARARVRRLLVERLLEKTDHLGFVSNGGGTNSAAQAWQRGLVHCTDEAAKELMFAIDAWDAADRMLMALPEHQTDLRGFLDE